jgi:glycine cleavage system aminomethyltransferase T
MQRITNKPLFDLGRLVATAGALAALEKTGQNAVEFLARHVTGDLGELPVGDRAENCLSLQHGFRLLSRYRTEAGDKLWVITEADRSATTLLLPDDY